MKQIYKVVLIILCSGGFFFAKAQVNTDQPEKTVIGVASWYSDKFDGRKTANGEIFRQTKFTAASNVFPLGTWLKVTHLHNKKIVWVKVNDRLHPRMKRVVDLTRAAAQEIGIIHSGIAKVKVEAYGKSKPIDLMAGIL